MTSKDPHTVLSQRLCLEAVAQCNTLQHTATHCNTLQHTATLCNTLQHSATHMQEGIPSLFFSRGFALSRTSLQHTVECSAVCCSVLQCVPVCCSVMQCVAVCCSVLQCVTVGCCGVQGGAYCEVDLYQVFISCMRVTE